MSNTFQVDLRGIVDLLSHHLYGSPQVYVRELLQNAVDAITAVRHADPDASGEVVIESADVTGDGTLRISDNGIGLTEAQVHELLATIGRSSKRDDLGSRGTSSSVSSASGCCPASWSRTRSGCTRAAVTPRR